MSSHAILIAIACGLAAAALFVSPLGLAGVGFTLSTFTAMPLFVSALGFGTVAGIISGVVASAVVGVFSGPLGALAVFGAVMAPAVIVGHLAGLMRNDQGVDEWYPLSRILAAIAILSAAIALAVGYLGGLNDPETIAVSAREMVRGFLADTPLSGDNAADDELINRQANNVVRLIPFVMPISLMLLLIMNFLLGLRIARRFGWVLRPREDLPTHIALPAWAAFVFVGATFLALAGGEAGFIGKVVSGAFAGGFLIVGLAAIHHLTRGLSARSFLLWMTYISLFILSFVALPIIALGVAETLFGLRARRTPPSSST